MPYIQLQAADGQTFYISSRRRDTLRLWLAEILPQAYVAIDHEQMGGEGVERIWPRVNVHPMWSPTGTDPDWPADNRVLGRRLELAAADGESGLVRLDELRAALVAELAELAG